MPSLLCKRLEPTFGVSRHTVIEPDTHDVKATELELDELGSFVIKKTNQVWIWIVLCRKTRQVVAYALGDRSEQTCPRLWEAIPSAYRLERRSSNTNLGYRMLFTDAH
jgi:hypothetical protein